MLVTQVNESFLQISKRIIGFLIQNNCQIINVKLTWWCCQSSLEIILLEVLSVLRKVKRYFSLNLRNDYSFLNSYS